MGLVYLFTLPVDPLAPTIVGFVLMTGLVLDPVDLYPLIPGLTLFLAPYGDT